MENSAPRLSELQFNILDGMADDFEDIERLYLYANRQFDEERRAGLEFPLMVIRERFPLRDLVDEIGRMLQQGYIEAMISNDERIAPQGPVNFAALHHYWFGPTAQGKRAWKAHPTKNRSTSEEQRS
jgi:hypothetical protein